MTPSSPLHFSPAEILAAFSPDDDEAEPPVATPKRRSGAPLAGGLVAACRRLRIRKPPALAVVANLMKHLGLRPAKITERRRWPRGLDNMPRETWPTPPHASTARLLSHFAIVPRPGEERPLRS